jgi:hypothetical protein
VIQNISGFFPLTGPGKMGLVTVREIDQTQGTFRTILTLPVVFRDIGIPTYEFNHAVQAYVDAGKPARLNIDSLVPWAGFGEVTVNGYLVSLQ